MSSCGAYYSAYPKAQSGSYAEFFKIQSNQENQYFAQNQWKQFPCLGTQVICFDVKYGALTAENLNPNMPVSLREQALRNDTLKAIIANRMASNCQGCQGRSAPEVTSTGAHVRPWSGLE